MIYSARGLGTLTEGRLTLLMVITGLLFISVVRQYRLHPETMENILIQGVSTVLLMIAGFATQIYPHIKAEWGGGVPISVTFYMSKDARLFQNAQLHLDLLDESESGYYAVARPGGRAIFFPRSAVGLIFYSDKPLEPEGAH